jgi:hypothetical protein
MQSVLKLHPKYNASNTKEHDRKCHIKFEDPSQTGSETRMKTNEKLRTKDKRNAIN